MLLEMLLHVIVNKSVGLLMVSNCVSKLFQLTDEIIFN